MGNEKSERIQSSVLNEVEKSALIWLAKRQPKWVTSDMLTFIGVMGAVVCAIGYALSKYNLMCYGSHHLVLSLIGTAIVWMGLLPVREIWNDPFTDFS